MPDASGVPNLNTPVRELARPDFTRLYEFETVDSSLARLRTEQPGERIIYFYVTDSGGRLVGVVPTRRLLLADPFALVRDIMIQPVISVWESSTFREALQVLTRERLLAVPVVDRLGAIKGVIDINHYAQHSVDIERRAEAEELFQLAGIHIEHERQASAAGAFRSRFPWLLCSIFGGLAAALITGAFNESLKTLVSLAFFIPVVLGLSEAVAMQSLAMALQSFQLSGTLRPAGMPRQIATGSLLGLAGGLIGALLGLLWLKLPMLAGIVFGGLLAGALIGAVVGHFLPRLIHRWRLDPKVASGPAVLALTDLGALSCYFGLASAVVHG